MSPASAVTLYLVALLASHGGTALNTDLKGNWVSDSVLHLAHYLIYTLKLFLNYFYVIFLYLGDEKSPFSPESPNSSNHLMLPNALAACVLSTRLSPSTRQWASQQLVRRISSNSPVF